VGTGSELGLFKIRFAGRGAAGDANKNKKLCPRRLPPPKLRVERSRPPGDGGGAAKWSLFR
jgi:hypothetical protein